MQDQLYVMTYEKMVPYWKNEIQSWVFPGTDNRLLAIAACALSENITLPKILLRYMVASIVRENNPAQVGITGLQNQDDKLKANLSISGDHYIALCSVLDNYTNIDLKMLNQGWSFSDRRNAVLSISRKDLITVIRNKIVPGQTLFTQLHDALVEEMQSFLTPGITAPVPKGVGSSKK